MLQKQKDDKNCQENINRRPVKSKVCADKKCQATKYYQEIDKNCQTRVTWPVKPQMDVQLKEPAKQSSFRKKNTPLYEDNNCRSIRIYNNSRNSDKNCQEKQNSNMWSMTKKSDVHLPKPAVPYEYIRLCKDKKCQSTRCNTKYDKNCQL